MNLDLKAQLSELNIKAAKNTEGGGGRKAIYNLCSGSSTEVFPENPSPAGIQVGEKVQWEAHCLSC